MRCVSESFALTPAHIYTVHATKFVHGSTFLDLGNGIAGWRDDRFVLVEAAPNAPAPLKPLSSNSGSRKNTPICTGVIDYFPDALAAVARLSKSGNDKHNPGEPLHWSRDKSTDHADCIARHLLERGTIDADGHLHDVHLAWRALANAQVALEKLKVAA